MEDRPVGGVPEWVGYLGSWPVTGAAPRWRHACSTASWPPAPSRTTSSGTCWSCRTSCGAAARRCCL